MEATRATTRITTPSGETVEISMERRARARYSSRDVILYGDGMTIDYIHYYDDGSCRTHIGHQSAKAWNKFMELITLTVEIIEEDL